MNPLLKIIIQILLFLLTSGLLILIFVETSNNSSITLKSNLIFLILFLLIITSAFFNLNFILNNKLYPIKLKSKNSMIYQEDILLVNKLNHIMNEGKQFFEILNIFTKEAKKIFHCKYITVFSYDENQSRLILHKESIMPHEVIEEIEKITAIKIPENISINLKKSSFYKNLIQNGSPVITNDPEKIYNRMNEYDDFTNIGILKSIIPIIYKFLNLKASLSIPLKTKDTTLGLINIYRNIKFSVLDLKRLEIISQSLILMLNKKLMEDTLTEALNKYSNLIYNTMDIIFSLDKEGKITFYNKSLESLLDVDEVELLGINITKIIPKNEKSKFENYILDNFEGKTVKGESIFIDKSFKEHYFKFNSVPLYRGNEIIGMQAIATDITEQKFNEIALQQSKNHYKAIIEDQTDLICRLMPDLTIAYANEAYCHYYKKDKSKIIGKKYINNNILKNEDIDKVKSRFSKISFKNQHITLEHKVIFPKNKIKWQRWSYRGLFNTDKKISEYLIVGHDITERKKAEIEINRLNELLIEKNKDLEKIIYISSQNLRAPLVNIQGFSKEISYSMQEILNNYEEMNLNKNLKEKISQVINIDIPDSLKYIQKSILKMDQQLSGLLSISKLYKKQFNSVKINVKHLLNEILSNFDIIVKDKNIKIIIEKIPECKGNKNLIAQVFSNLIDNAVKYRNPKKDLKIHISGYKKDNYSIFCVEDNGIGISETNQKKIFEIFHRINNNIPGEGLGLNIANKIVKMHNGIIWVESKENKGSKFYFSLQNI